MLREAARPAAPVLMLALFGGCSGEAAAPVNAVAAPAEPKAALSPAEAAQQLVRNRVGTQPVRFGSAETFTTQGASIVCGRFAQGDGAEQRYIAVGEQDLFIESEMEPGHMDRAAQEFCRNA